MREDINVETMKNLLETQTNLCLIVGLILFLILLWAIIFVVRHVSRPEEDPDTTRQRDPHDFYRDERGFQDTKPEKRNAYKEKSNH
jgi:hypothetical protein